MRGSRTYTEPHAFARKHRPPSMFQRSLTWSRTLKSTERKSNTDNVAMATRKRSSAFAHDAALSITIVRIRLASCTMPASEEISGGSLWLQARSRIRTRSVSLTADLVSAAATGGLHVVGLSLTHAEVKPKRHLKAHRGRLSENATAWAAWRSTARGSPNEGGDGPNESHHWTPTRRSCLR